MTIVAFTFTSTGRETAQHSVGIQAGVLEHCRLFVYAQNHLRGNNQRLIFDPAVLYALVVSCHNTRNKQLSRPIWRACQAGRRILPTLFRSRPATVPRDAKQNNKTRARTSTTQPSSRCVALFSQERRILYL